jgi:hypothetical protein
MEADLHSRGSISAVHELEVAAYGNHGLPPPVAQLLPLPAGWAQASNTTMPLGTAISLPVDDVLARISPNTPVEDALLDLYLMLSEAGSPLYLFDEVVGFVEKHAGRTFEKGVTLPRRETLIKQMQQQHNVPPPVPIPVVLENGTEGTPQYRRQRKDSVTVQAWLFEQMMQDYLLDPFLFGNKYSTHIHPVILSWLADNWEIEIGSDRDSMECYTEMKVKEGPTYRAHPNYWNKGPWQDWANVSFGQDEQGVFGTVPSRILLF